MSLEASSSLREVALEVCTALDRAGVVAVLTGGSAAAVHAPGTVHSFDLDFVLTLHGPAGAGAAALAALGFTLQSGGYIHARSPFLVEFPSGPLAIGGELIEEWDTVREGGRLFHVITPTDSCRDRLAWFFHANDRACLEQAVAVARAQRERLDLDLVRAWSEREGALSRFGEFFRAL